MARRRRRMQLSLTGALLVIAMPATLPACDREKQCTLIGCSNQIEFDVKNLDLERRNVAQAKVCFDGDCRTGTARFNAAGRGQLGSNGIGITPSVDGLIVTSELPLRAEWDEETPHDMTLQLSINGDTLDVGHEGPLERSEPNGPGCGVCWNARLEVSG